MYQFILPPRTELKQFICKYIVDDEIIELHYIEAHDAREALKELQNSPYTGHVREEHWELVELGSEEDDVSEHLSRYGFGFIYFDGLMGNEDGPFDDDFYKKLNKIIKGKN